jgi:acetyltransferase-like isoleucine patch superfamily enzyme
MLANTVAVSVGSASKEDDVLGSSIPSSSYMSNEELEQVGFKSLGQGVRISRRASIYQPELMSVGDNVRIDDFSVISGRVVLGRNVFVAVHCNIAGGSEGAVLEDFSTLAYGCNVFSQSDDYSGETMTNSTVPTEYKNETKRTVRIGRHVIVGTGSCVFPGVDIADGCSIGAMSLVNESTEPWMIYVGSPARALRPRSRNLLVHEKVYLAKELDADRP